MTSYLPDKFAGKAYKFLAIDSQVLAESRDKETLPCDDTIVGSEDIQSISLSVSVICVF